MSILQSKQSELRFLRRQQLEEEARVIGNYYRDCIRQFGIDCVYHKLDTREYSDFKHIIDQNTILRTAYGYDSHPDYHLSVDMVTYPEIDQDIFALNKFGVVPQTNITFIFDSTQFACDIAERCGQLKEYPIEKTEIVCEVPEIPEGFYQFADDIDPQTGIPVKHYLSDDVFPYDLGQGYQHEYNCGVMKGKLCAKIHNYVPNIEQTIQCDPYEHADFNVSFPVNSDLYKSLRYKICNTDYIETMLFLTYVVTPTLVGKKQISLDMSFIPRSTNIYVCINALQNIVRFMSKDNDLDDFRIEFDNIKNIIELKNAILETYDWIGIEKPEINSANDILDSITYLYNSLRDKRLTVDDYKYILKGHLHGNVLFYDLNSLGKYIEKSHPMVGDIIEIDFPDENNREKYQITDCFDKQLSQDGLNPLLHKYIWKCSAVRYVNSYEENAPADNEADARLEEQRNYKEVILDEVADDVSMYPDNEDAVYGGYDSVIDKYDKQQIDQTKHHKLDILDYNMAEDIMEFECGSKLITDGYELIFVTADDELYTITIATEKAQIGRAVYEHGLKFLKASDSQLVFVNILGECYQICEDDMFVDNALELTIDSLFDKTITTGNINQKNDSFYKFTNTRTVLLATPHHLFCKLASNNQIYKII